DFEHIIRFLAGPAGAHIVKFALEDLVGTVGPDDSSDVQSFAGHSPEGLHGIHATPVTNESEDLAVRARQRSAYRHWHTVADRAAHVLQPVVRWCTGRERIKAAASSHRLIDHNGLLGNQVAEDSGNLVWIERAHWHVGPEGLLHRRVLDVG